MPIELNYRKLRPLDVDALAKQYEPSDDDIANDYNPFAVSEIQSFSPLYSDFFQLNESNYNRIGLNHRYYLETDSEKIRYHVKCSPLLDPIHYRQIALYRLLVETGAGANRQNIIRNRWRGSRH